MLAPQSVRRPLAVLLTLALSALLAVLISPAAPARADGPGVGTPWVVTLGDSYISGEAGRWAGSSNDSSSRADALGSTAYFDNAGGTGETIDRCHRSKSAEAYIGGAVSGLNLANLVVNSNGVDSENGVVQDDNIHIEDLIGTTNTITNSTITDARNTNLDWDPNSSSGMSTLTVSGTTMNHAGGGVSSQGNAGINLTATGNANVKLVVTGGQVINNAAAGIQITSQPGSTVRSDLSSIDMVSSAPPVDATGATWGNGVGTNFGISIGSADRAICPILRSPISMR